MHHRGCRKPQMPPKMVITNEFAQSTHKPYTTNENAFACLRGKNWPQEATRNAQRHASNIASRYPSYRFFISFGISSTMSGYSKGMWAFFHSQLACAEKPGVSSPAGKYLVLTTVRMQVRLGLSGANHRARLMVLVLLASLATKCKRTRAVYRQLVDPVLSVGESSCVGADCGPRREVSKTHINRK